MIAGTAKGTVMWGLVHPRAIDRFRPIWAALQIGLFIIGSAFWVDTTRGGDSFSPETWGTWACKWEAEVWAAIMLSASVMTLIGLMNPIKRWMIVSGAMFHFGQFTALSLSAALTGGQFVVAAFALVMFAPMHLIFALEAYVYDPTSDS